MHIEEERQLLAVQSGLTDNGWKYNQDSEEIPEEGRFFCRKEDWRPDTDFNHLIRVIQKSKELSSIAINVNGVTCQELFEKVLKHLRIR